MKTRELTKNTFGTLTYKQTNKYGLHFEIERGDNRIIHVHPWMRTEARMEPFGDRLDRFPSFTQAVAYLKANADYLD